MSKKVDTEQKYFIGNWIQNKTNIQRIGLIYGIICVDNEEYQYAIGFLNEPFLISHIPQSDIENNYELIPYPWQLFFKVGDKVKAGSQEGKVDRIFTGPKRKDMIEINCGDEVGFINCAPHELIKIGE